MRITAKLNYSNERVKIAFTPNSLGIRDNLFGEKNE
jgi:hypothetical protein